MLEHLLVPPGHTEAADEVNRIFNYASAFVKLALLYHDTHNSCNSYSMDDADKTVYEFKSFCSCTLTRGIISNTDWGFSG